LSKDPAIKGLKATLDGLTGLDEAKRPMLLGPGFDAVRKMLADPKYQSLALGLVYDLNSDQPPTAIKWIYNDPILGLFNMYEDAGDPEVVPVAAAGNVMTDVVESRRDFPLAPAIWDSVVSVSAVDADAVDADAEDDNLSGDVAGWSRYAEVKLGGMFVYDSATLRGSSFASPVLSAKMAIYLLNGGHVRCDPSDASTAVPPLGYGTDSGPWKNLTVSDASVEAHCAVFTQMDVRPI
jgi:hypothetical protein